MRGCLYADGGHSARRQTSRSRYDRSKASPQAAALSFSKAELFRRLRSRSPEAAWRRMCSAISSRVTDSRTKKRRSVTTSFNAWRMTATVDASYFCVKLIILVLFPAIGEDQIERR